MVFVTAGMGGGTGTGAAPVVARCAKEMGILTVGVVTKPFHFEGVRRMRVAEPGIVELQKVVDTLLIIPNQNLFRVANEKTTFADAFAMADQVLHSGVACITDLMVKEGLINLDFADVRAVMREMGKAMMGTGEASGEKRALSAAEAAISNPLIDDASMKGAKGLLISITGGRDLTLYEVDEAATRIREEVDQDANIIVGATFDESLEGIIRVSVVATGIDHGRRSAAAPAARRRAAIGPSSPEAACRPAAQAARRSAADRASGSSARASRVRLRRQPHAPRTRMRRRRSRSAAKAAVAAAVLPITAVEDVTIRPMQPKPSLFPEPCRRAEGVEPPPPAAFIPPAPERPANRGPRDAADRRTAAAGAERAARAARRGAGAGALRRSGGWACCSGSPRSASAAARRRRRSRGAAARNCACRRAEPRPPEQRGMPPRPAPAPRPLEQRQPDPVSEYARRPAPPGARPARAAGSCA